MTAFPHRVIRAMARTITASLEFRCGDACSFSSSELEPTFNARRNRDVLHLAVSALTSLLNCPPVGIATHWPTRARRKIGFSVATGHDRKFGCELGGSSDPLE